MNKSLPYLIGLLIVSMALALWWFSGPRGRGRNRILTPAELIAAANRRETMFNEGIAYLENGEYSESVDSFTSYLGEVPQNVPALKNRALAGALLVGKIDAGTDPSGHTAAIDEGQKLVAQLLADIPNDVDAVLIAAELWRQAADSERLRGYLEQALKLDPENPRIAYALARIDLDATSQDHRSEALKHLQLAYEQGPENLWVLLELLPLLAEDRDPQFIPVTESARKTFGVLQERVQRNFRTDVDAMFGKILDLAKAGKWVRGADAPGAENVMTQLMMLKNVTKPDDACQSDRLRIEGHPLDLLTLTSTTELEPASTGIVSRSTLRFTELELSFPGNVIDAKLADFDLDGRTDLCLLTTEGFSVFLQVDSEEQELSFEPSLSVEIEGGKAFVLADLDDDATVPLQDTTLQSGSVPQCHRADLDLVICGLKGTAVWRNDLNIDSGERTLTRLEAFETPDGPAGTYLTAADVDLDGDLDLLIARPEGGILQYSNLGNLSFRPRGDSPQGIPDNFKFTKSVAVDLDRDIDLDVVIAGEDGRTGVLENLRHGLLRWQPLQVDSPINGSAGLAIADVDRNGTWDVLAAGASGGDVYLGKSGTAGRVSYGPPVTNWTSATDCLCIDDFDNDGYQAAVYAKQRQLWCHRLTPAPTGEDASVRVAETGGVVTKVLSADLNRDGKQDLLAIVNGEIRLYRNSSTDSNHWLNVSLVGEIAEGTNAVAARRINHYGLGALLEIRAGQEYQCRFVDREFTHFGLGKNLQVDSIRIVWPNGIPEHLLSPQPESFICEKQTLIGSCPFLYTWNGEQFEFVTDLLWAAPLGLPSAAGGLTPYREWEYLLVPGSALKEKEGKFTLQITEELREAGYFDEVRLIAVDHPAEIQVYSNEKVGPPGVAEHRIHTVREPRLPVRAVDGLGRDLLAGISQRDHVYVKPFEQILAQGYTSDSILELDLGDLGDNPHVTLFLTGWLFPPDAGVSVALQENPDLPGPVPPSLWVPDGAGGWKEATPFTGFPGGKTKTIALDLKDVLNPADHRIQLRTSMHFAWDHIFFSLNEEPGEYREYPLELVHADLHERGFSARIPPVNNGPELFDYTTVSTEMKYLPLQGRFTRFGDVTPLLRAWDDQMVVLGPGDEMTVEFAAPEDSLPKGWIRDFILYNVGWDKDAQLQTVYGMSSEPMPFRGMSGYPYAEEYPESDALRDYLQKYQTRRFEDVNFRQQMRFRTLQSP